MNFGLNLKLVRIAAGLTQNELADELGITQTQLSRYERGEQVPSVVVAVEMASALGVDMNELTRKNARKSKIRKPEHRYLVESVGQDEQIRTVDFLTLKEANDYALQEWNHLTPDERKSNLLQVWYVEKTIKYYMKEDLESEDWGWESYIIADMPDGAFDSDEFRKFED